MEFKELTTTDLIAKAGTFIAAGQNAQSKTVEKKVVTAQFPAERAAASDTNDSDVKDLYQNGILFTAYEYSSRKSPDMRNARQTIQTAVSNAIKQAISGVKSNKTRIANSATTKDIVANILMPRSKTDNDTSNHKFNDVGESLITRGNGSITGTLSNLASTAVFGAIESMTQGAMADFGEQIYNTSRSMYAGAENRTKTYVWDLTPRTAEDLKQIIKIYEIFNWLSYGTVGNSQFAKMIKENIDATYRKTFINKINDLTDTEQSPTVMESITSFLSNVITVSNPTIWFIQNFGTMSQFDGVADIFGPAQIQSIRFDKAPDGNFSGLAIAPNMPSSFVLEVTFREILTLNRASIYGEDIL